MVMKLNWNFKMWGAIGVVACLLMASGLYLSTTDRDLESVSVLARVNDEGSGIFIRASFEFDLDINISDNWGGLTFMTPGPSSIQHMILNDIVTSLHLSFVQQGPSVDSDKVYWTQVPPGLMVDTMLTDSSIAGGISWEPHFAIALAYGGGNVFKKVATTAEYDEGHPCCVIAANNTFLNKNENAVYRFLAGYVKAVEWINNTLETCSEGDEDWDYLIQRTINLGTPASSSSTQMSKETALDALDNIKFTYEINHDTVDLADQYVDIIEVYKKLGIILPSVLADAGFETSKDFAEHLIQDQYLAEIFDGTNLKSAEDLGFTGGRLTTIKVAYLNADIHQLALHVGSDLGFFKDHGIHVDLKGPYGAGGDVMNALLSKHADIGFLGSPPVISSSFNVLRS